MALQLHETIRERGKHAPDTGGDRACLTDCRSAVQLATTGLAQLNALQAEKEIKRSIPGQFNTDPS